MKRLLCGVMIALAAGGCAALPSAALDAPDCVALDAAVVLDARSSSSRHGVVERYRFDFGDGTPAVVGPNATQLHRYASTGRYEVELTVTDSSGRTGGAVHTLDVVEDSVLCGVPPGDGRIRVSACLTDGVLDCPLDLGSAAAGSVASQSVQVTNVGTGPLRISGVALESAAGPFVLAPVADTILTPGQGLTIPVTFAPSAAGRFGQKLLIPSNAANNPPGQHHVTVELEGLTPETPFPRLSVTPRRCDYGQVALDQVALCGLTLSNTGTASLSITGLLLLDAEHVFSQVAGSPAPFVLAPSASRGVTVQFVPREAHTSNGTFSIQSNDAVRPTWDVPLHGEGVDLPPVALIRVLAVNGRPPMVDVPPVAPLDDVVLTGEDSAARRSGRAIASYQWELVQQPPESRATLTTPTAVRTGFSFNSSGQPRAGLDVNGVYVVHLSVTDTGGLHSVSPAVITLTATNTGRLHIELTWMDDHSDMDLHLVRTTSTNAFTPEDCYFGDCTQGDHPVWSTRLSGLPSLDVDDTTGFGPENITLQAPEPGVYLVGVHYYNGHGDTQREIPCRVKVFVEGVVALDASRRLSPCNAYWEVARVQWDSNNHALVESSGAVVQQDKGTCSSQPP